MKHRDHRIEARRWAKFPATVLIMTGVVWLIDVLFDFNMNEIGDLTETLVGAMWAFTSIVVVPLGSMITAVSLLFLQRWSIWAAAVLPLLPLIAVTIEKAQRIASKFAEYRVDANPQDYKAGVLNAILILGLWAVYLLVLMHLKKTHRWLNRGQAWLKRPPLASDPSDAVPDDNGKQAAEAGEQDDYCLLMPEIDALRQAEQGGPTDHPE